MHNSQPTPLRFKNKRSAPLKTRVEFYRKIHFLRLRPRDLIPEMILVCDYDILILIVELNTLISVTPLNEWQNLKLEHFEVGNFGQKLALFSAIMSIFSPLGAPELLLRG